MNGFQKKTEYFNTHCKMSVYISSRFSLYLKHKYSTFSVTHARCSCSTVASAGAGTSQQVQSAVTTLACLSQTTQSVSVTQTSHAMRCKVIAIFIQF